MALFSVSQLPANSQLPLVSRRMRVAPHAGPLPHAPASPTLVWSPSRCCQRIYRFFPRGRGSSRVKPIMSIAGDEPRKFDEQIRDVEQELRKIEERIRNVEQELTSSSDPDKRKRLKRMEERLWKKEDQLREKELLLKQEVPLWKKEEQLREKELLLKQEVPLWKKEEQLREKELLLKQEVLLWKKEEQLWEKELQLRKKEEQLWEKELQLRKKELRLMSSPLEAGHRTEVSNEDPLYKFVAALHKVRKELEEAKTTPGVAITLEGGVAWLGNEEDFTHQIFVRTAYIDLRCARNALKKNLKTTLFTGTPGIGKSHLAALMVANYLVDEKVVVLEMVPSRSAHKRASEFYRLELKKDGTPRVERISPTAPPTIFNTIFEEDGAVFVVDGSISYISPIVIRPAETLIFASAQKEVFVDVKKHANTLVLYVPLFDLEELVLCASKISSLSKLTREIIEEWFTVAGGIARIVLKVAAGNTMTLQILMSQLNAFLKTSDLVKQLNSVGLDSFPRDSDFIFHWAVEFERQPGEEEEQDYTSFTRKCVIFASRYVVAVMGMTKTMKEVAQVAMFCMRSGGQLQQAAKSGYWFEHLAHMSLLCGGEFECRLLGSAPKKDFKLTLRKNNVFENFHSPSDAASLVKSDFSVYCMPWGSNQVALDALNSPVLYFQMASGSQHGIKRKGIQSIVNSLLPYSTPDAFTQLQSICKGVSLSPSLPLFVFVTTPFNFANHYKSAELYLESNKKHKTQEPLVEQAVLNLPLHSLLRATDASEAERITILQAFESMFVNILPEE